MSLLLGGMSTAVQADHLPPNVFHNGWVRVSDGTELRMQYAYPKIEGVDRFPTLLVYQGYTHATIGLPAGLEARILRAGYALMVVAIRGTGCSEGTWDFLSEQEARDAADVIDWIADQPWSNEKVAMIGGSYAGFEQLPVASLEASPPQLVAIAPAAPIADLYRDAAYPGGIANSLLPNSFSATVATGAAFPLALGRPGLNSSQAATENYVRCAANQSNRPVGMTGSPAALFAAHRWDDAEMQQRAPAKHIERVDIPTLTMVSWQDDTLGSRPIEALSRVSGPFHAILTNGDHLAAASRRYDDRLFAFLDHYVKGVDNGFDETAPIEVWWETQRPSAAGDTPAWTSELPRYPAPNAKPREFFFDAGRGLSDQPGAMGSDSYAYVAGTGSNPAAFAQPSQPGTAVSYTSAPLTRDLTALGSASADLWLSSSAADTDVQVLLTEIRADGLEQFVQAGWLRASHRKEDPSRSTPTSPFHTHQLIDAQLLTPGQPALMRVQLNPFGHVFRKGSRLRLTIEAPAAVFGEWSRDALPTAAVNTVHWGPATASVLRLTTLPGHAADADPAPCGSVVGQPCRLAQP